MTPLAHRIVKELTLPIRERKFVDQGGLARRMDDVHCFELSEVYPLIHQFASTPTAFDASLAFLPAPKTWIEWQTGPLRIANLLEGDDQAAEVRAALRNPEMFCSAKDASILHLGQARTPAFAAVWDHENEEVDFEPFLYAALAIINSPRLIGRKQHMPHRGLERRLANAKGLVGKFPLHAWTEIKLSVADIGKRADGTEHEAHYTGEKCLHFCRSHLRIRNGKLERVTAHWRGNPALGIKQSRYAVTA